MLNIFKQSYMKHNEGQTSNKWQNEKLCTRVMVLALSIAVLVLKVAELRIHTPYLSEGRSIAIHGFDTAFTVSFYFLISDESLSIANLGFRCCGAPSSLLFIHVRAMTLLVKPWQVPNFLTFTIFSRAKWSPNFMKF